MKKYDLFGIENPLIDLLVKVPDEFLTGVGVEKNKMYLVDLERHKELQEALGELQVHPEPGGSCANTLLGIAQLGGKTAYCGKVGEDEYGRIYSQKLEEAGVASYLKSGELLTGSTVILVTPDASRTMNTYLGACQELEAGDLPLEPLADSGKLYITGYLWDTPGQQAAARLALRTAKEKGIPVAMSLSDPFCVARHKEDFISILKNYVSEVFANREEALALTDRDNTQQAMQVLREWCSAAAITMGGHGALAAREGELVYLDPFPADPVDTTGAGDAFAAGFLYGEITGAPLLRCGRLGSYFAAQVIQQIGPRLEGDVRSQLSPVLKELT